MADMARRIVIPLVLVVYAAVVGCQESYEMLSEDVSFPLEENYIDDVDFDNDGISTRAKRAAPYTLNYRAPNIGYYPCGSPEGIPGSCKPLATCANYYGSPQHYDLGYGHYKSCNYGYGHHGVCCPEVIYSGFKPSVINYNPRKYDHGYDPHYKQLSGHVIEESVKYCEGYMAKHYDSDSALCKDEKHPSYWGNGIAQEHYMGEYNDYAFTGFLQMCMTTYLTKHHGYKPLAYFEGGIKLIEYSKHLPARMNKICHSYYKKCYPSKYRSIEGYCNNLKHPYWGAANTGFGRIIVPQYWDSVWAPKRALSGNYLPNARYVRTKALPDKNVEEPNINTLYVNFGQFITHDVTHALFYQCHTGNFVDCCQGYKGGGENYVSPKCYPIVVPHDDPFYKRHGQSCLNLARIMVAPNFDCALGYANPLSAQTSVIDCSLIYGHNFNTSAQLRTFKYGLMKMSKVDYEYYLPTSDDAECFPGAGKFCMKSGDFRTTIHPGMTHMQILGVRFHNLCAKQLYHYNPYWSDEKIFQECRRITIAVFQHITFMEYLPLLLGWRFMYDYGLLSVTKGYSWDYSDKIIPWTLAESAAAAMRHHSMVYGKIVLVDEYYKPEVVLPMEHYYNNDKLYQTPSNMNKLTRGYLWTTKRKMDVYYDPAITDFLLMDPSKTSFGLDLASINMLRGREFGIRGYNYYREVCGLKRAHKWEDFHDTIPPYIVAEFKKHYEHVDDLDLYDGGIAEIHVQDSILGPVFWCILGYQFQQWKWGDRYFYTLGGHPHSFTLPQLDSIRSMSMAALVCMTTTVKHVPTMSFRTPNNYTNPLVRCDDLLSIPRLNFEMFAGKY